MEMAECGAACLCMVLDYHGARFPLSEVRTRCGASRDGVSALTIVRAARSFGLTTRAFRAEEPALRALPMPAILHWEFNHFVVLERIGARGAVIVDPASGRRTVPPAEFDAAYTGVAITMNPGAEFRPRRHASRSLARYLSVLRDCWGCLWMICGLTLLLELLGLAAPVANQILVDHVLLPERHGWVVPLTAALAVSVAAQLSLTWLRERALVTLTHALDLSLVSSFVDHLLRMPMHFLEQRTTGDLIQRVQANSTLRDLSTALVTAALDALLVVSYSALMLTYNLRLGAFVIVSNLLRLAVIAAFSSRTRQLAASTLALQGRESSAMFEGLTMPETVRAFGAEALVIRRFADRLTARLNASLTQQRFAIGVSQVTALFDAASVACILALGGGQVLDGELSAGMLVGVLTLRNLLSGPFAAQINAITAFVHARGIIARIDDVLDTAPERSGTQAPARLAGSIRLEHVTFRHADEGPALCDDLCLSIRPGEKIAIVGRTGTGKTTLSKLLLGLLEPSSGQVSFDGQPLATLELSALRRQIGVVLQEPFLFDETVLVNLRLCRPDATFPEVQRAARLACIDSVIEALPQGYETRLGASASRLSRGQRQRLALARALLADPRILLLDEATSSLDLETEARVHENLAALRCTRIVIAHRLATVRDADRILVLEGGKIAQ
ncbi:MAG TPA: peptidase domain-containing ABC transporter, partial [Polyangiales bacterium]|nr:peptidase domain-containing ABC transporter [Polyangiales bacterium]